MEICKANGEEKRIITPEGYVIYASQIYKGIFSSIDAPDDDENNEDNNEEGTESESNIEDIFDENGKDDDNYNPDKLHIGDFINYTAGNWTSEEIQNIKTGEKGKESIASGIDELPSKDYQFGSFAENTSRDESVPNANETYEYIKEEKDGTLSPISGWRLFDIDKNQNEITLISAGCTENYFHPNGSRSAYISEYILSGNISEAGEKIDIENNYTKRDWNEYVNENQNAISARSVTKSDLDNWFNKHMNTTNADTEDVDTFQSIYDTRYESLIDNYSYYWVGSARNNTSLFSLSPYRQDIRGNKGEVYGVRVLVKLSYNTLFSEQKVGTKTLVNPRKENEKCTYGVWDIVN